MMPEAIIREIENQIVKIEVPDLYISQIFESIGYVPDTVYVYLKRKDRNLYLSVDVPANYYNKLYLAKLKNYIVYVPISVLHDCNIPPSLNSRIAIERVEGEVILSSVEPKCCICGQRYPIKTDGGCIELPDDNYLLEYENNFICIICSGLEFD